MRIMPLLTVASVLALATPTLAQEAGAPGATGVGHGLIGSNPPGSANVERRWDGYGYDNESVANGVNGPRAYPGYGDRPVYDGNPGGYGYGERPYSFGSDAGVMTEGRAAAPDASDTVRGGPNRPDDAY